MDVPTVSTSVALPGIDHITAPAAPAPSGPRPVAPPRARSSARSRPADKRPERDPVKDRLSIPVTPDRTRFAYEVMQEKTKDELRQVLLDPALPAALGLAPAAGSPLAAESWGGDFIDMAFDMAGGVFAQVAEQRGLKLQPAHVAALGFSAGERKQLGAPLQRVLDRWLPGGFGKWNDEVMLAACAFMIVKSKIDFLRELAAAQRQFPGSSLADFPRKTAAEQTSEPLSSVK